MTELRVTSIWSRSKLKTVFAGVPLTSDRSVKSARQIIVVTASTSEMPAEPHKGQCWKVEGLSEPRQVERDGYRFTELHILAEKLEITLPHDGEHFIRFVSQSPDFKGIGEVKARQLWSSLGEKLYAVIQDQNSEQLAPYLSEDSIQALYYGWEKYSNLQHLNWFVERDIPGAIVGRLIRHHGRSSIEAIQTDPYRLMNFGMGWNDNDALAQKRFQVATDDPHRQAAAIEDSLLALTKKGHTIATRDDLTPLLWRRLKDKALVESALIGGYESKRFVRDERDTFHAVGVMIMERVVALRLQKLVENSEKFTHEHDDAFQEAVKSLPYPLTERQKDAVAKCLVSGVSVITGGAGTGKTTVLKVVMNAYRALGYHIFAMALSGRAAMRIKESTHYPSRTIAGFLKNDKLKELEKNIIVIDEASMVDLPTMYRIITHIPDTARILLVGDAGQLQPIGPGLILHDIVKADTLPVTELDVVKRQDSSTVIPEYTRQIKAGQLPDPLSTGNIRFHESAPEALNDTILRLYAEAYDGAQIVAATYKAEHGGIDILNQNCQEMVNLDSP